MWVAGYASSNARAAALPQTAQLAGPWDAWWPFWAWTLLPYLSLNVLCVCAFFVHPTRRALDAFALRLAAAQAVCLAVFWLWPIGAARQPPAVEGLLAPLWAQLRAFDQPVNLFPSLHVAVLVWSALARGLPAPWRWAWHGWCALLLTSTLTTWQHDLVDVLGGLLVGLACLSLRARRCA